MQKLLLIFFLLLPRLCAAQDTAKVSYGDTRYMAPTFKTKKGFQVYDVKECSENALQNCPPDGRFIMYGDSAMKRKLYIGNIENGKRDGVWSYVDKQGNTVCEEEYISGRLVRYTIFRDGVEVYEYTSRTQLP